MNLLILTALVGLSPSPAEAPRHEAEQIFTPNERQTHAPGIVETLDGELLASWYGDSGGGRDDDAAVFGARRKKGETSWSDPFVRADRPGFPDCNTAMMVDGKGRLWLFWPTVLASSWE